jgi:hypothetical protein
VANQVLALKQALQWAAVNKPVLRTMGETALCYAANRTHKKMHAQRHRLLSQALQQREQARADS